MSLQDTPTGKCCLGVEVLAPFTGPFTSSDLGCCARSSPESRAIRSQLVFLVFLRLGDLSQAFPQSLVIFQDIQPGPVADIPPSAPLVPLVSSPPQLSIYRPIFSTISPTSPRQSSLRWDPRISNS
ncbi:hypothetical protein PGT21_028487 [Puccinia graminis f. sp. tritici]|uniref:Uncharacterized protein n=1 Tax=Puccinia graminis f. sp. tritici TaxID=56615 RepID=A0A5B0NFK4_PUCGR|nr:hypothetical protein PGT21_028487 [Puccinia graminis f. sp. tritici]